MRVLITGAAGQVGRALLRTRPAQIEVRAPDRAELDIGDEASVRHAVASFAPDSRDQCRGLHGGGQGRERAARGHHRQRQGPALPCRGGARHSRRAADPDLDRLRVRRRRHRPLRPDDPTGPISVYGQTKLVGEQMVQEVLGDRAVILRTAWIYAPQGKNFLLTMLRLMNERGTVNVVSDQRGSPTTAGSVAAPSGGLSSCPKCTGCCTGPMRARRAGTSSPAPSPRRPPTSACCGRPSRSGRSTPRITPTAARGLLNSVLDLSESATRSRCSPCPGARTCAATLRTHGQSLKTSRSFHDGEIVGDGRRGIYRTNFVYYWLREHPEDLLVVLDALTYAGNKANLFPLDDRPNFRFVHGNICDTSLVDRLLRDHKLDVIVHFAAESHVDRSITEPDAFIETNVSGTHSNAQGRPSGLAVRKVSATAPVPPRIDR